MTACRLAAIALCAALCGSLAADDFGDAPASYGLLSCWAQPTWVYLGSSVSDDTSNPVSPAWTGDSDDGLVGSPLWNPVSWQNELTVHVGGQGGGWLMLWVDANDNGGWEANEFYLYSEIWVEPGQDYTFTGIRLNRPQGYSLNGPNKVAVRVVIQDNFGGPMHALPTGFFYIGEIEDWLIDCMPAGFAVTTPTLRDMVEGVAPTYFISGAGGTPPYTWSVVSGALPAGVTLVQSGDNFAFSGAPSAGAGAGSPLCTFEVQCADATAATVRRTYSVRVLPPPYPAPFTDTFSTDFGWVLGSTWDRAAAISYTGQGFNLQYGEVTTEPGTDATPGSSDNMILADSLGGPFTYGQVLYQTLWATSPIIDCGGIPTVQLRYRRWASTTFGGYVDGHDRLRVQVSAGGGAWQDVWKSGAHAAGPMIDNAWTLMIHDISAIAAGQPNVRVRFGVGPSRDISAGGAGVSTIYDDFAGWCLDDVQIMRAPVDALQVSAFALASPLSFQHPANSVTYPVGLKNYTHTWQATLGNSGGNSVDVTGIEVGITFPEQPGNSDLLTAAFHAKHLSWYDAGEWSLGAPVTVTAGASGVTISGTLDCNGLASYLALQVMRCELFVRGTDAVTGQPVESRAVMECVFNPDPPGLHVWDAPGGGAKQAEVANGEAATGLRNFGSVAAGSFSAWINIICNTTSSAPFTVSAPTLTGADAAEFELYLPGTWPGQPVQGQNNVWFSLRFKPSSLGVKTAWVEFAHTAPNAMSPFTFEIKGLGVGSAPIVGLMEVDPVTGFAVANGATAGGERDFGQIDLTAAPPAPREFYVVNTGTQTLTLGTPVIPAGPFALDLTQFNPSVSAGSYTTIIIEYAPSTPGVHTAWIEFSHNDAGTADPFTFEVKGEGVINAPVLEVRLGGPFGPVISSGLPAGGMTLFGTLDVGSTSGQVLVYLRNLGQVDLAIGLPAMSGTHAGDFVLDSNGMAQTLGFGQATTFLVAFAPVAKGLKSAAVSITHNDTQAPQPFTIPVAGVGVDPNGVTFTTAPILPAGKIGDAYAQALAATGGNAPYTFALVSGSLPVGMTLAADGTLTGTPMGSHGIFTFRARVIDALLGDDERQFELIVQPPPGHVEKGDDDGESGCAAATGGTAFWWVWLVLAAWQRRRRRV